MTNEEKDMLNRIWASDIIEVITEDRLTYFFINHARETAYYFEICLN